MPNPGRKLGIALSMSFAVLFAGCLVTSVGPLSDETHPPAFDNALLGGWIRIGEDGGSRDRGKTAKIRIEPWETERGPAYRITHTETDNQAVTTTVLRGSLVEIGSLRILDTEISEEQVDEALGSPVARVHLRGVHFFSKVTVTDNTLVLSSLRNQWFMAEVLEEGAALPCIFECGDGSVEYCHVLLTGSPRRLREFFLKYGERAGLFDGPGSTAWRRE